MVLVWEPLLLVVVVVVDIRDSIKIDKGHPTGLFSLMWYLKGIPLPKLKIFR